MPDTLPLSIPGLVFLAPAAGLATVFALLGAAVGFLVSLIGYGLFKLTGGRVGTGKISAGTGVFQAMMSPVMLSVSGVLAVVGTYVALAVYYGEWAFRPLMTKMSGESFGINDAGPVVGMLAASVGVLPGWWLARKVLPPPPHPRPRPELSDPGRPVERRPFAPPGPPTWGVRLGRFATGLAVVLAATWVALAANNGNWAPGLLAGEVAGWFRAPEVVAVDIGGGTGDGPAGKAGTDGATGTTGKPRPWTTYRGGPARTGSADDVDGPATATVIWTYGNGGTEKFLAAPSIAGAYVLTGGTNANIGGMLHVLHADDKGGSVKQLVGAPDPVDFPIFSPPAVAGTRVVVGEGLHEHTATRFRCLDLAATGKKRTVWALPVKSHAESGPAVVGDRMFAGAGDEGVLCVSLTQIAKPAEDDEILGFTPAEPKVLWQSRHGDADKKILLHTDSSPAVADDVVVIGSGRFTEHDGRDVGDASVVAFAAGDGKLLWRHAVAKTADGRILNPWGSPAVADGIVYVGCSTCRFDPAELKGAAGAVVALDLKTGALKFRIDLPGGVLSSVAVAGGTIFVASTEGFVRAYSARDGRPAWSTGIANTVMAPPTVAGSRVYLVDTAGIVYAFRRSDGGPLWTLDLRTALGVSNPGLVYCAPAAARGRLYLGTDSGWFVCIGEK